MSEIIIPGNREVGRSGLRFGSDRTKDSFSNVIRVTKQENIPLSSILNLKLFPNQVMFMFDILS
jgi:hypothetical protein